MGNQCCAGDCGADTKSEFSHSVDLARPVSPQSSAIGTVTSIKPIVRRTAEAERYQDSEEDDIDFDNDTGSGSPNRRKYRKEQTEGNISNHLLTGKSSRHNNRQSRRKTCKNKKNMKSQKQAET